MQEKVLRIVNHIMKNKKDLIIYLVILIVLAIINSYCQYKIIESFGFGVGKYGTLSFIVGVGQLINMGYYIYKVARQVSNMEDKREYGINMVIMAILLIVFNFIVIKLMNLILIPVFNL
ncbi:hypothetical protein SAMN02745163_01680 [Clostridium cavendishii DSM 21758]|uniref:Uncharacterized protein n=1 Tax=Clostridium cavendishii DSM 21758 TaxID=1121302 RepID=A0A1M6I3H1_9CLOT|nr:hypothetical protein [Clostridium cavendishii]SHJ28968.1 hypothetical protein SAMN02745163_01680 [Clostridium cavendishii DSM 21758]